MCHPFCNENTEAPRGQEEALGLSRDCSGVGRRPFVGWRGGCLGGRMRLEAGEDPFVPPETVLTTHLLLPGRTLPHLETCPLSTQAQWLFSGGCGHRRAALQPVPPSRGWRGGGGELPGAGPGPSQGPRVWAGSARRVSSEMGNLSTRLGFRQNQRPGVGKVGGAEA